MDDLHAAALTAARECLGIQASESVLIVTDPPLARIGKAFQEVCRGLAAEVTYLEMPQRQVNGAEPPAAVREAMKAVDVVICPTSTSLTHTDARRGACQSGARVGTLPGITEDVLIRTMKADYHRIKDRTEKVAAILTRGKLAHITTPAGTDITVPIDGISAIPSTGLVLERGSFGNLPSGEAYLMPEEGKSNGRIVVDGSLAGIGITGDDPVQIIIENGLAVSIEGGRHARELEELVKKAGTGARNLAELGVGTNDKAELKGTVLEDEKVLGTVHLALGNNVSMGGTVNVGFHVDGILLRPTVTIDDFLLLKAGRLLVK